MFKLLRFFLHLFRVLTVIAKYLKGSLKVLSLTTLYTNEECQRRGNWVRTTCPELLRSRALAGNRTHDLLIGSTCLMDTLKIGVQLESIF